VHPFAFVSAELVNYCQKNGRINGVKSKSWTQSLYAMSSCHN